MDRSGRSGPKQTELDRYERKQTEWTERTEQTKVDQIRPKWTKVNQNYSAIKEMKLSDRNACGYTIIKKILTTIFRNINHNLN